MRFPSSIHAESGLDAAPFTLSAHGPQRGGAAATGARPQRPQGLTWTLVGLALGLLSVALYLALRPAEPVDPVWTFGSPGAGAAPVATAAPQATPAARGDLSPALADEKAAAQAEPEPAPEPAAVERSVPPAPVPAPVQVPVGARKTIPLPALPATPPTRLPEPAAERMPAPEPARTPEAAAPSPTQPAPSLPQPQALAPASPSASAAA
ncbi:hypothetical protein I7X39_02620, partial [Inhella sp. 1Y17]|nr:hypothetical protein [Inhella proteolytica]